jgi:glycine oxidase
MNSHKGEVFDVAIIGGGTIGLSCAWKMASRGAKVVLFERLQSGREASFAAGGMLAPSCESALHPWECSEKARGAMLDFCFSSRNLYPAFAAELLEETGLDIELSLRAYPSPDWKEWREPGILYVSLEEMDPRRGVLLERGIKAEYRGKAAVFLPDDGQVDNRKLVDTLKAAALKRGVEMRENSMIRSLVTEGGRAVGVTDGKETTLAQNVLLCAGAWSGKINGVPPEIAAGIRPVAGQMVQLRGERRLNQVIYSQSCYLVPRRDGRLIVGATVEEVGFQKRVTAGGVSGLLKAACELVPELENAPLENHWAGLRPMTPDALPMLGPTSLDNLFVSIGHGRNGILLSPATAEALTSAILDQSEIPAAFSSARFAPPNFPSTHFPSTNLAPTELNPV